MTPLTDTQLDDLARLEGKAVKAPWIDHGGNYVYALDNRFLLSVKESEISNGWDTGLIAEARNALPALLAELRLLRTLAEAAGHLAPPAVQYAASLRFEVAMNAWLRWKAGEAGRVLTELDREYSLVGPGKLDALQKKFDAKSWNEDPE